MDPLIKLDYNREIETPFTDSLTGLFNYSLFQVILDREVKRSERYGEPFSLAFIDIDSFHRINQRHGHIKGDRLLKQIASLIEESLRQSDHVARYAGDVFAVIMIKAEENLAWLKLEKIRQAVLQKFGGNPTISIGLASFPREGVDRERLTVKARESLMSDKKTGRDRTHYYNQQIKTITSHSANILIVDDLPFNVKQLEGLLCPLNYQVFKAFNGKDALDIITRESVDLILLDIMMPDMNGYEVCRRIKGNESTRLIPVIMVTSLNDGTSKVKGIEAGADDFITKPPQEAELLARTKALVRFKKLNNNLTSIENVIFSLANAVEANDKYTSGHVERVSNLAMALGRKMNLSERESKALKLGGALHDVGKIGVSHDILNKPSALTRGEWKIIKKHPTIGYTICLPFQNNLGLALNMICCHHERLDGSGYPEGLQGEEIPTAARVMAVVDMYDALITDRPYRKRMSEETALKILHKDVNENKLDGDVFECLKELLIG